MVFELYKFSEIEIVEFALLLVRFTVCLAVAPIFGNRAVPQHVKILLGMTIAFILFPVSRPYFKLQATYNDMLFLITLREVAIGLTLGFIARMFVFSLEVAGQVLSFALGLNSSSLLNPATESNDTVLEQFQTVFGLLVFLSFSGHHMYLMALHRSIEILPVGVLSFSPQVGLNAQSFLKEVVTLGLRMGGPVMAVTLVLNIAQGIMGRMVPQINVFTTSFQVNIIAGLAALIVVVPVIAIVCGEGAMELGEKLFFMMKQM